MFTSGRIVFIVLFFCLSLTASAELNLDLNDDLTQLGVDATRLYNEGFSYYEGLYRIDQIKGFLESFRALTEDARETLSDEKLQAAGNTAWDIQYLGFNNIPQTVEGALRKQNYQLAQLEYELAQYKFNAGDILENELTSKRNAFEKAEADFQKFWDSIIIYD